MNKKIWVIPLVLLILLSLAGAFRWDKEPVQSFEKPLKIQAMKDRWTGQTWVELHGTLPNEEYHFWSYTWLFAKEPNYWNNKKAQPWQKILHGININPNTNDYMSGQAFPYFTDGIIKSAANDLKKTYEGIEKRNELKKEILQLEKNKQSYSKGHTQYIVLYESLKNDPELIREVTESYDIDNEPWGLKSLMVEAGLPIKPSPDVIRSHIPTNIVTDYYEWRKTDQQIKKLDYQISNIDYWYKAEALKQLTNKAESTRIIATITWIVLIALSFVMTLVLFFKSGKSSMIIANREKPKEYNC
ncbi:MAG: hypothetical protein GX285_07085 [Clostridiales bacterium]|jgi:hypothetical protein|nr:hypothetical protein [Clostridiales bacterium]